MTRYVALAALALILALLGCPREPRPVHLRALADLRGASDRIDQLEVRLHAGGRAVARAESRTATAREYEIAEARLERCRIHAQGRCLRGKPGSCSAVAGVESTGCTSAPSPSPMADAPPAVARASGVIAATRSIDGSASASGRRT